MSLLVEAVATDFGAWREEARRLLSHAVHPEEVSWSGGATLGLAARPSSADGGLTLRVPKHFLELAEVVALHREELKWSYLYRVLFRLTHGGCPELLRIETDADVHRLLLMEKAVRRDMHKMKAFARFQRVSGTEPEEYVAWHRPDHLIVRAMAPWFRERFHVMHWSILTPDESARWDGRELTFGPGMTNESAVAGDKIEDLWRDYYGAVFNPARVKIKAMKREMPVRHWATLPEAQLIPQLLVQAKERVDAMNRTDALSASPFVPLTADLGALKEAAVTCQGCELYRHASRVVFGEGPRDAKLVMVGEQPGDEEDRQGLPFVGPAGRLLDRAMAEVGLDRRQVYVTNAVKHFKFVERGKRRIHMKPGGAEISACRPWLEAELGAVKPDLIVCLGATAAQSLMGRAFRITSERGQFFPHRWAKELMATIHPSALLRMEEPERREEEFRRLVDDLRLAKQRVAA